MSVRLPFRWLNRLYARANGYFWLPCPKCGRMFGGHEYGKLEVYVDGRHKMTCRLHDREHDSILKTKMREWLPDLSEAELRKMMKGMRYYTWTEEDGE